MKKSGMMLLILTVIFTLAIPAWCIPSDYQTSFQVSASKNPRGRSYYWKTVNNVTASGNTTIVAAVSGQHIKVVAWYLSSNNDVQVKFQTGTTDIQGSNLWSLTLNSNVGQPPIYHYGWPVIYMETEAGEDLNVNLSGAAASGVNVTVCYYTEE